MKHILRLVVTLLLLTSFPWISSAADPGPGYPESVQLAIGHAANPAGWLAPSLFVIRPDAPVSQGLNYDANGALIVRTAAGSWNFRSTYVGQPDYKIFNKDNPTRTATWVTTGNDATNFLIRNGATGATVTKLLERGLGMDTAGTHHAIIEFAVLPTNGNLQRPTRNPDIAQYLPAVYGTNAPFVQPAGMSDATYANFRSYYDYWMGEAYSPDPKKMFPWTQLGYTFFWGNGANREQITGMSEFIMLGGTEVGIHGIYATQSYPYTRNDGSGFSSAENAQFGNGFASFKIDGACDTVWAGHRFQKYVLHDAGTPNRIIVENNGSVSGGQGLLIWSLNYDVVNSGFIGGATADKFNIPGTANVAVLFQGDTGTGFGAPVLSGVNRVVNSGTISSPGAAIKAEAGNTLITNNAGGVISGGSYAVQTGGGNDTVTVNGGAIAGNIDLGAGTDALLVTGAGNATFTFALNRDTAASARVANVETVAIADNTTLAVKVAGTGNIRDNDRFLIADAPSLTVNAANIVVQNDGVLPMLTFSAEKSGNRLSLLATRDNGYYRVNSGNAQLGAVIDSLANTATGDMAAMIGALDGSGSAGNARQLEPRVDRGTIQASYETVGQFNDTVMGRIDQVLAGRTGRAGGPAEPVRHGLWAQGFGSRLSQGTRGESDGYDASLRGASVGYDTFLFPYVVAGFGGGYARSNITTRDADTRTDVDSYLGNFYGSFAKDATYLNGIVSYAYNRYDAGRHIAFGAIDRVAKSSFGGQQYSGYLEGGQTFTKNGLDLTPLVSLHYLRLHLNGYTETDAGSLNLAVEGQKYKLFQTGLGARLAYPILRQESRIIPEVHAKWLYDFAGDRQQSIAQFTGGGASFATEGFDPARSSYIVGAKLTLLTKSSVAFALSYDFEKKDDFSAHRGYVNLRYAF